LRTHENTVFNSNNTFAITKPKIIMNDFGGTLGGPLASGRSSKGTDNETFFFASFEGLRLPRETPILLSVPSMDMRNGNLTELPRGAGRLRPSISPTASRPSIPPTCP
jgi:hypothetical protein